MPLMWDNVTENKFNIFGRVWLLNTETKEMQTFSIDGTILATKHELFFTNVAPIQNITDIVLLGFLSILFLYFILYYYLLFCKEFIFFQMYILVNTIFECCYKLTSGSSNLQAQHKALC